MVSVLLEHPQHGGRSASQRQHRASHHSAEDQEGSRYDAGRMSYNNSDLARAFPVSVQDDMLRVVATLPQPSWNTKPFQVRVEGEGLLIPCRIYHDPALIDRAQLTPLQEELLDCLLTRHYSGFIREKHLRNIVSVRHDWVAPFVVQLVGEYVIEILDVIRNNLDTLNPQLYRHFLKDNPLLSLSQSSGSSVTGIATIGAGTAEKITLGFRSWSSLTASRGATPNAQIELEPQFPGKLKISGITRAGDGTERRAAE